MTIKELRESKGLSQGKFADSIGIGRTAIVGYEKGKFKPSAEVAAKIKEVYGVTVDEAASAAPAPVEEKKTAKRGKKKDTPAEGEVTPSVEEKKSAQKKGGRKKAALASEMAPATEEKKPAPKKGGRKKAAPVAEEAKPAKRGKEKEERPAPVVEEKVEGIAAAIKALRTAQHLSQAAFAESIGLKTNTVSAYEQGRIKPSETAIAKIKEVYGALDAPIASETAPAAKEKKTTKRGKKKDEEAEQPAPKKPTRRGKKGAPAVEEAKPVEEKKPAKRGTVKKDVGVVVVIQSPMGGSITPEEILKKTGPVDTVYVRVDENKAYWVRGEETGSVDLW